MNPTTSTVAEALQRAHLTPVPSVTAPTARERERVIASRRWRDRLWWANRHGSVAV